MYFNHIQHWVAQRNDVCDMYMTYIPLYINHCDKLKCPCDLPVQLKPADVARPASVNMAAVYALESVKTGLEPTFYFFQFVCESVWIDVLVWLAGHTL